MGYYKDRSYNNLQARHDGGGRVVAQPAPTQQSTQRIPTAIAIGANGRYCLWTADDLKRAMERGYPILTNEGEPVTLETHLTLFGSTQAHPLKSLLSGEF